MLPPPGVGVNNPGGGWFANAANADELGSSSEGVKRKGSEGALGVGSRSSCSCPNLFPEKRLLAGGAERCLHKLSGPRIVG